MLTSTSTQYLELQPSIVTPPRWQAAELQLLDVGSSSAFLLTKRLKNLFAFSVNFLNRPFRLSRPVELTVVRDGMCVMDNWLPYPLPDSVEMVGAGDSRRFDDFPRRLFSEESRPLDIFWRTPRLGAEEFSSAVLLAASTCASPAVDMLARRFALRSLSEHCAADLGECSRPRG
jgi:hypothetical protein